MKFELRSRWGKCTFKHGMNIQGTGLTATARMKLETWFGAHVDKLIVERSVVHETTIGSARYTKVLITTGLDDMITRRLSTLHSAK